MASRKRSLTCRRTLSELSFSFRCFWRQLLEASRSAEPLRLNYLLNRWHTCLRSESELESFLHNSCYLEEDDDFLLSSVQWQAVAHLETWLVVAVVFLRWSFIIRLRTRRMGDRFWKSDIDVWMSSSLSNFIVSACSRVVARWVLTTDLVLCAAKSRDRCHESVIR